LARQAPGRSRCCRPIPHLPALARADTQGGEQAVRYEIRIQGVLDQRWSSWFDGLQLTSQPGGVTVLAGPVTDQAALHGLLAKVRDLGLPLLSVRRLDQE
jgi:hypothetical protein